MSRAGKSSANTSNSNSLNRNRNNINTSRRNTPNMQSHNIASIQFNRQFNIPFSRNHISRIVSCPIFAENEDEYREQYLQIQNMMLRLRIEYLTRSIRNHFINLNRNNPNPNSRVPNAIPRSVRRRIDFEDSVNRYDGDNSTDSSSESDNENFHTVP